MDLTKEQLFDTAWDVSGWTKEMKIAWQEKMFEMGFGWSCLFDQEVRNLENSDLYIIKVDGMYVSSSKDGRNIKSYRYMIFEDIFQDVCDKDIDPTHFEKLNIKLKEDKDFAAEVIKLMYEKEDIKNQKAFVDKFLSHFLFRDEVPTEESISLFAKDLYAHGCRFEEGIYEKL